MDTGLLNAGIQINQAFEIDKDCCKTYRHNIGDHVRQCDISQQLVLDQHDCNGMVLYFYSETSSLYFNISLAIVNSVHYN